MKRSDVKPGDVLIRARFSGNISTARKVHDGSLVRAIEYGKSSKYSSTDVHGGTEGMYGYGESIHKSGWLCERVYEDTNLTKHVVKASRAENKGSGKPRIFVKSKDLVCSVNSGVVMEALRRAIETDDRATKSAEVWGSAKHFLDEGVAMWESDRERCRNGRYPIHDHFSDGREYPRLFIRTIYMGDRSAFVFEALRRTLKHTPEASNMAAAADAGGLADMGHKKAWEVAAAYGKVASLGPHVGLQPGSLMEVLTFHDAGFVIRRFEITDSFVAGIFASFAAKELDRQEGGA